MSKVIFNVTLDEDEYRETGSMQIVTNIPTDRLDTFMAALAQFITHSEKHIVGYVPNPNKPALTIEEVIHGPLD